MVKKSKKPKAFVKYDWKEESRHIFSFAFVSKNGTFEFYLILIKFLSYKIMLKKH